MRKTIMSAVACVFIAGIFFTNSFAQDEGPKVKFGGDVQIRERLHFTLQKDATGKKVDPNMKDYTNQYAWNFRVKAMVNENIMLGFRLSNPSGYASDKITDNLTSVTSGTGASRFLAIPEAYFKWNAGGFFYIAGGIIPVLNNVTLSLVARETNGYAKAGDSPWKVHMNNSQTGMDLGFNFINNENTQLGLGVVSAIATDAVKDSILKDQVRFIVSVPVSVMEKKLSFLPVFHMRTNAYQSEDFKKSNISIAAGCDIGFNPVKQFSTSAGFAFGMMDNTSQEDDPLYNAIAPMGILAEFNANVMPGFGKAMFTFRFSNWKDRELDPTNSMIHFDVKYSIPVLKLAVMPRLRVWHYTNSETDATTTDLRPELLLIGKF